jgi:hypothetical protein
VALDTFVRDSVKALALLAEEYDQHMRANTPCQTAFTHKDQLPSRESMQGITSTSPSPKSSTTATSPANLPSALPPPSASFLGCPSTRGAPDRKCDYYPLVLQHVMAGSSYGLILVLLSDTYSQLRRLRLEMHSSSTTWTAPDEFRRSCAKYWVHPSNLMQV